MTGMESRPLPGIRIAVAGLLALAVAMGIGRFAFTPLLPMMVQDAGLTVASGGWLASANYAGYLAGAVVAMFMQVRAGTAVRLGLLAIALVTAAMGLEHDFTVWITLRFIAGVANAWAGIYAFAWSLERIEPLGRPVLNGVVFAGVGAGIAAVGALCVLLMHLDASSAQVWMLLGAVSLALTVATWRTFAPHASALRASRPGEKGLDWSWEAARLTFFFAASGFGYIVPATFLPAMARQAIQDPAVFGWSWPLFGMAALVSTLLTARLAGVLDNRRMLIGAQLIMAAGVALPAALHGIAPIMLAALAVGGTFMVITMVCMQEARVIGKGGATGLMAALTAAFAFGQIVGPLSVSWLIGPDGDFSAALYLASAVLAAGAAALARPRSAVRPIVQLPEGKAR
jgi:MFS family permease